MKTLNLLIKRELLQIFKFNKILHGEKKGKKSLHFYFMYHFSRYVHIRSLLV